MKIVEALEESGLIITRLSEAIKNEIKQQKGRFGCISLGILGTT